MKMLAITITLVFAAATAEAQSHADGHYIHGHDHHFRGHDVPANGHHHASTYEEGLLRGVADFTRALGQRAVDEARGRVIRGVARRVELDNEVKTAKTFFEKRAIRKAAVATLTVERKLARRQRIANAARPNRLGPTQYRADLGLLNWPSMLRLPAFASLRDAVDTIVAHGRLSQNGGQVHQLTRQIQETMPQLINDVTPHDYYLARKFLKSLQYETQLASRGLAVASR